MSQLFNEIFLETATCGFKEETGSWEMDIVLPEELSPSCLNNFTCTMIRYFLIAFHQLCKPIEIRYESTSFSSNSQIQEFKEGLVSPSSKNSHEQLVKDMLSALGNAENSYFTHLFLDCDLQVFIPDIKGILHQVWVPQSGMFYLGYVLEDNEMGLLVPTEGSISFFTSIDVWVEKTLDSSVRWRSNYACAIQNQPLLKEALEKWENLVGKPIIEWNSRYYRDQIFKYGFKSNE
ncbi:hypothetical protein Cylst_4624 [Cylindrospermum stagnale PCC 7417]|uniref:Uncharacterized protein n=1 Tax=Cylindrospermum stagnale PCC 7417 TaxID=56107 RepID=K9X3M9_9NOST|nr:hypothetical protein [Cylindrospermum stagnale]AFZ26694.1 hypothetical protein Cylst_4624 [Cylindrospermum stagnale PCC 7417]